VKISVEEGYILVLGVQILLGFDYRSVLEKDFDTLPVLSQYVKLGSQALLLIAFAMLVSISARHQIVFRGENNPSVVTFVNKLAGSALLPFALALGLDLYVAGQKTVDTIPAIVIGSLTVVLALLVWYGLGMRHRASSEGKAQQARAREETRNEELMKKQQPEPQDGGTPLKDKIENLLTEIRVVLPGAQALLGFQLAAVLIEGFDKLPSSSKLVHLGSLVAVAITIVLLMAPAAYHRISESGEETEDFFQMGSRALIAAMVFLALGLAGDFYIVVAKILDSSVAGVVGASLCLLMFYGMWFGYSLVQRRQREATRARSHSQQVGSGVGGGG